MSNMLDDLNNKMDKLLNNNFKSCYHYSSIVMIKYKKLLMVLFSTIDSSCFKDNIDELKEYILKEYESYEKLLSFNKTRLIPKIDELIANENDLIEEMRFRNMLKFTKNIFTGYEVSCEELLIDCVPNNMKFDIYSAILASIYVKLFKNIKEKLDSLSCEEECDELFVNSLYRELNTKMLYRCCDNDLFEIICLFNDMDVDKLPDISMNILRNKLIEIFYGADVDEYISDILFNLIVNDISKISVRTQLNNSSEDVFEYLYITMKIDTIMSYMNKEYLQKLYNYCSSVKFENIHIHSSIKRLVKIKFDNEE